ncbi:MAG: hypothetical protein HKP61_18550 [Dactylosporangium sp.]|nr:hypothetical protein [Dactylosporangium sp.]NNJ62895.1 hypothetical protein [Dactylosporangium sp.]
MSRSRIIVVCGNRQSHRVVDSGKTGCGRAGERVCFRLANGGESTRPRPYQGLTLSGRGEHGGESGIQHIQRFLAATHQDIAGQRGVTGLQRHDERRLRRGGPGGGDLAVVLDPTQKLPPTGLGGQT